MKKFIYPLVLVFITILFFYKSFFLLQIPFPGDLLISEYAPWKYESYLGYNPGSYPNKAQYFDVIRQLYPWKILSVELIKTGEFPLWNPYNFSGSPLFANNQSSVLNPFNLLFFMLAPPIAWSLYIIIQPFLAGLFTYLFLRQLKLKPEASIFGGIAFGFSLFMSAFLEYGNVGHTILWLPLLLFCIDKFVGGRKFYGLLIPPVIGFVFFAGHLQIAASIFAFLILYSIFRCFKNIKKTFILFSLLVLGVGVSAIQILPTIELLSNSARVSHAAKEINELFLLQINQLILFIAPDFYGNPATRSYILTDTYPGNAIYIGILPILMAVLSFFKQKKDKIQIYFISAVLVFLTLFIRNPISEFIFNQKIFSASSPSNFFFLLSFSLSVLGAYGLDRIKEISQKSFLVVGICGFSILTLVTYHKFIGIEFYQKNLLLGILIFITGSAAIIFYNLLKRKIIIYAILAILTLDLFYYFIKFNPFVPEKLMYPPTKIITYLQKNSGFNRYIGYKAANIESNYSTLYNLYSPDGYDPLYPKTYNLYTESQSRSDVALNISQDKQIDELGVKYLLDRNENGADEKIIKPEKFKKIGEINGWFLYENSKAYPRAYIKSGNDLVAAKITHYSHNKVVIQKPNVAGLLVLSDNYYPGWSASIDGVESKIQLVNQTFRGVEVDRDSKSIEFVYKPNAFYLGLILTIISLGSLGIYLLLFKYVWKKL